MVRGDKGEASTTVAPPGEEGSEAVGGLRGNSLDKLTKYDDMAARMEALSQSGAW